MAGNVWTSTSIPSQNGRTAVVTGANSGLGLETAAAFAARGAHVVLAVRDASKGEAAAESIRTRFPEADLSVQRLDLASLESIHAAASELKDRFSRIDLLINNAGVMMTPKGQTADGFELQFGVDHLGPFAFTGLLLERLLSVPGSRVVTVSSAAHRLRAGIHFDDLQWERSYDPIASYGQAKLANLLFTYQLQHRLSAAGAATIAVAAHPGTARTELTRYLPGPMKKAMPALGPLVGQSAAMGALPTLRAATDPDVFGGQYFGPRGPGEQRGYPVVVASSEKSHDLEVQKRLWKVSDALTGVTFPI